MSNELSAKLPPTDSRLRPDLRAWESNDLNRATDEKSRLENNQRDRRKQLKKILKEEKGPSIDMYNEQEFYEPQFFEKKKNPFYEKKSDPKYLYEFKSGAKSYWQKRETADWASVPPIYSDQCPPFYK